MATVVLPMLFPRAQVVAERSLSDEAASFSAWNLSVKKEALRIFRTVGAQAL
jgi:hypothetical protein